MPYKRHSCNIVQCTHLLRMAFWSKITILLCDSQPGRNGLLKVMRKHLCMISAAQSHSRTILLAFSTTPRNCTTCSPEQTSQLLSSALLPRLVPQRAGVNIYTVVIHNLQPSAQVAISQLCLLLLLMPLQHFCLPGSAL